MSKFKVGDKVRVLKGQEDYADVEAGDVGTVAFYTQDNWIGFKSAKGIVWNVRDRYLEFATPSRPDPLEYLKDALGSLSDYSGEYAFATEMLEDCYGLRRKVITKTTEEVIYEDIT